MGGALLPLPRSLSGQTVVVDGPTTAVLPTLTP
jgi:hypothetical protein